MEWCRLLQEHEIREVLDLGSGGGHHLYHLVQGIDSLESGVAVDLSVSMLAELHSLLPRFDTVAHDMTTLRLGREFDLVSVHDSFCYLNTTEQVGRLFETVRLHLKSRGVALVKLDAVVDDFEGPYRYLTTFEDEKREVTLTHYEWDPKAGDGWLEVVYLFLERERDAVTTREERHRLGLFSTDELLRIAKVCGLSGSFHRLERWDEDRENLLLQLEKTEG